MRNKRSSRAQSLMRRTCAFLILIQFLTSVVPLVFLITLVNTCANLHLRWHHPFTWHDDNKRYKG